MLEATTWPEDMPPSHVTNDRVVKPPARDHLVAAASPRPGPARSLHPSLIPSDRRES